VQTANIAFVENAGQLAEKHVTQMKSAMALIQTVVNVSTKDVQQEIAEKRARTIMDVRSKRTVRDAIRLQGCASKECRASPKDVTLTLTVIKLAIVQHAFQLLLETIV